MLHDSRKSAKRFMSLGHGLLHLASFTIVLSLYLPIITLIIFSFTAARYPFFPVREWSLKWYEALWNDHQFFEALTNSIIVSGLASVVATLLGFLAAYSLTRSTFHGRSVLTAFMVVPLSVPLVLLALSLRIYFATFQAQFNLFTVFLGHMVYMVPLSILILRGRFQGFPWSHEEAAFDLGAGRMRTLLEIVLPWMMPAVIGSILLNFTFSFDEFIIAWFLTNFEITLPIKIWTDLLMNYDPKVNVIGTIVFLLSVTVAFLAMFSLRKDNIS